MNNISAFDWTAVALLVIGGINWGMIAAFDVDLVSYVFGEMTILTRVVYAIVGASALYIAFAALYKSSMGSSSQVAYQ